MRLLYTQLWCRRSRSSTLHSITGTKLRSTFLQAAKSTIHSSASRRHFSGNTTSGSQQTLSKLLESVRLKAEAYTCPPSVPVQWQGHVPYASELHASDVEAQEAWCGFAEAADWNSLFAQALKYSGYINATRLWADDGHRVDKKPIDGYAALHHAVRHNAGPEIVGGLLALGAYRGSLHIY